MDPRETGAGNGKTAELHGWKEIAEHLNRSVRTAQRWEREFGLPVRRLRTAAGESVYAVEEELDEWKRRFTTTSAGRAAMQTVDGEDVPPEPAGRRLAPVAAASETPGAGEGEPASGVAAGRRWRVPVAVALAILVLAAGAWLAWPRVASWSGAPASTSSASPEVLDAGPWPARGHDMRRSNSTSLRGPGEGATARIVHGADRGPGQRELVVTSDRRLIFGECGWLQAIDEAGKPLWKTRLEANGLRLQPTGIVAALQDALLVSTTECPDVEGGLRTALFLFASNGLATRVVPQGATYGGPAVGPDRSIYTLDEVTLLRAYTPWGEARWATTLAGFSNGGLAIDARGSLYAGTDGGRYHQSSLWCVRPDGEVAWRARREDLGLPAIGPSGDVYVASLPSGTRNSLHAYSPDGRHLWSADVGHVSSHTPLAVSATGTILVHTSTGIVSVAPDGTVRWRFRPESGSSVQAAPVVDRDGNVYAAIGDQVFSIAPDGKERWRVPVEGAETVVAGGEERLYVVGAKGHLVAIESGAARGAGEGRSTREAR